MARFRLRAACALLLLFVPVAGATERTFIFSNSSRDLAEFRAFARQAARMKPYGQVQIDIGVLAQKATFELPPGGNEWHQYAVFNANLSKFFPHPKIAPFLPAGWAAKNRELLLAKAAILREFGLGAALSSNDTHYLPEAFFERYPHLRGPRVDHPRRSRREEFSWCVDRPETLEMIEAMMAEAKRSVPEIKTILIHVNDSGTGLCWADWQYPGPNGPRHCRTRGTGLRVRGLVEAIRRGALKGGGEIDVRVGGMFSNPELDEIARHLPPHTYLSGRDPLVTGGHGVSDRDPTAMGVGTLALETYPVLGLINPLGVLAAMKQISDPRVRTCVLGTCLPWYYRHDEPVSTVSRLIDIVTASIDVPAKGMMPRFQKLHQLASRWGGENNANRLFDAFYLLDETLRLKTQGRRYASLYAGVSTRHITRPLVLRPEMLTAGEEAYFLPFIFNVSEKEARNDYLDIHGGRSGGPQWDDSGFSQYTGTMLRVATMLEDTKGAPDQDWLRQMALSLRMWVSVMQSVHNVSNAQRIRDARSADLGREPRAPAKTGGYGGDPEYLQWYSIQRDELDNTAELIRLLEAGGLAFFAHARRPEDEDTFLLGPDPVGDLGRKQQIMRAHWLDAQKYFASPFR
ncbi:MAG: hypothetical protein IT160_18720 [Bryobacterales bacterium]|nr:hypothetical protein [Bryobacterales bacterium]